MTIDTLHGSPQFPTVSGSIQSSSQDEMDDDHDDDGRDDVKEGDLRAHQDAAADLRVLRQEIGEQQAVDDEGYDGDVEQIENREVGNAEEFGDGIEVERHSLDLAAAIASLSRATSAISRTS